MDRWDCVAVPGNWQMQGYDVPIYTDIRYPFPADDYPHVPEDDNPTGSYRRLFTIPGEWDGRRVFLNFEGIDSAFHLWVNGHKVGYSQGSRLPAEFDVTPYVRPGENVLAARVYRWSAGCANVILPAWSITIRREMPPSWTCSARCIPVWSASSRWPNSRVRGVRS